MARPGWRWAGTAHPCNGMHKLAGFAERMSGNLLSAYHVLIAGWMWIKDEAYLWPGEQAMGMDRPLQAVLIALEEINEWWDPE